MDEYTENYVAENSALRRKLQSKAEALLILSQELEQCRVERDQFKLMAEQIQGRYSKLKKMCPDLVQGLGSSHLPGRSITELVEELHERNKSLILEQEDLKQKLRDAHGDMKVLRAGLQQRLSGGGDVSAVPSHQREELVQQLEVAGARCAQLQADVQSLLDEKEEMVTQRDAYKCKVHRLNHQLSTLLRADSAQMIDIDALIMENKYLQERLQQAQEEKDLSQQVVLKYKGMLEKKRSKGSVRLGANGPVGGGMVVSHKQVQQLLQDGTAGQIPNTEATLADLRSLCLALLEALQDKSLALSHQKKSNKILAGRVYELEQRLESVGDACAPPFPSQLLLNGYLGSHVDRDLQPDLPQEEDAFDEFTDDTVHPVNSSAPSKVTESDPPPECKDEISYDLNDGDERLPPRLQELILNALHDIENEKESTRPLDAPPPSQSSALTSDAPHSDA